MLKAIFLRPLILPSWNIPRTTRNNSLLASIIARRTKFNGSRLEWKERKRRSVRTGSRELPLVKSFRDRSFFADRGDRPRSKTGRGEEGGTIGVFGLGTADS